MAKNLYSNSLFTSESVTEGHPDKICDQISDAVLDAIIAQDENARVACETLVTTGLVLVAGEITTNCYVDIPKIVRKTITDIGYDRAKYGFDGNTCSVLTAINEQSPDIALGLDGPPDEQDSYQTERNGDPASFFAKRHTSKQNTCGEEEEQWSGSTANEASQRQRNSFRRGGAGDQGMMFGFACNQTPELMPLPISLAHKLAKQLADVRKNGTLPYLRPDGKTQVTVQYDGITPIRVDTIVVSTQHAPEATQAELREDIIKHVIKPIVPENLMAETKILTNPTGSFVLGGPSADSGLTGRKIIVDTYGGYASHGGGAFSGKDPTKVDRSAAYVARFVAKSIVAREMALACEVQLAYAIGVPEPVSVMIETFGTEKVPLEEIQKFISKNFDLTPAGIIKTLNLRKPIYQKTASYGHFGREEFTWEQV